MEIITAMIIYALAEGIKENDARMDDLQEQIVDLNNNFLNLAGKHSTLYALHKLDHDTHHKKIDNIIDTLETLTENE